MSQFTNAHQDLLDSCLRHGLSLDDSNVDWVKVKEDLEQGTLTDVKALSYKRKFERAFKERYRQFNKAAEEEGSSGDDGAALSKKKKKGSAAGKKGGAELEEEDLAVENVEEVVVPVKKKISAASKPASKRKAASVSDEEDEDFQPTSTRAKRSRPGAVSQ